MNDSEKYRGMSDDDLAKVQEGLHEPTLENILIEREWLRRDRIAQHELDLDLVLRQVRWMKFAAILGAAMTLTGAIAGAILTSWLSSTPQLWQEKNKTPKVQSQTSSSTAVDYKEKDVLAPSQPPVKNSSNPRLDPIPGQPTR